MAITGTVPVSLSDLAAEYGVSAPYSLTDFLGKPGAPASPPVSITDYLGLASTTITLDDELAGHIDPGNPTSAGIRYESDGDVITLSGGVGTDAGDWISPKAAAPGSYEIRATLNSGTSPTGSAVGSWLALSTNREWSLSATAGTMKTCQLTIEIRLGATVLDSCTVTIVANSTSF